MGMQLSGSLELTGSFTTSGTITAQTLVVQTITSSITQMTGSNVFGSTLTNTQRFTGSVLVTGSLAITTTGTEFQVNPNGVNIGNALTDSHVISGSFRVNPNGLFVSSSGNVGIGFATPAVALQVSGTVAVGNDTTGWGRLSFDAASNATRLQSSKNGTDSIGLSFWTQASGGGFAERMIISGSNVGIGTSTPGQLFEVVGGEIKAGRVDSSQEGGQVSFGRSTDNSTAWYIDAYGNTASPQFRFINVTNAAVVMTMTGSNVGIGTSSPSFPLQINSTNGAVRLSLQNSDNTGYLAFTEQEIRMWRPDGSGATLNLATQAITGTFGGAITFSPLNTERGRFTGAGELLVGTTNDGFFNGSVQGTGLFGSNGFIAASRNGGSTAFFNRYTSTGDVVNFRYAGSNVGSISTNGSTVTFSGNAASDNRLKDEITPINNALEAINSVEWVKFKYKSNGFKSAGVTAQQLKTTSLADFVIDGMNEEDYKAVDYNAIIGYLGKAIQELEARVKELENK